MDKIKHTVAVFLCRHHSLASIGLVLDAFRMGNQVPGRHRFSLRRISEDGQSVPHPDGLLSVDGGLAQLAEADLVVIPSLWTMGDVAVAESPGLVRALAVLPATVRVAALCTGAYLLAASGRLDQRLATTHWMLAEGFGRRFPHVNVQPQANLTHDDGLICSGGSLAAVDACLHAMQLLAGQDTAEAVARMLVTDLHSGPQSLYMPPAGWRRHADPEVRRVQDRIEAAYAETLPLEGLAALVHTSVRTLQRRFVAATGLTPVQYQQQVRIERSKAALASSSAPVAEVALQAGYQDRVAFGRLFKKMVGTSPAAYRQKHRQAMPLSPGRPNHP